MLFMVPVRGLGVLPTPPPAAHRVDRARSVRRMFGRNAKLRGHDSRETHIGFREPRGCRLDQEHRASCGGDPSHHLADHPRGDGTGRPRSRALATATAARSDGREENRCRRAPIRQCEVGEVTKDRPKSAGLASDHYWELTARSAAAASTASRRASLRRRTSSAAGADRLHFGIAKRRLVVSESGASDHSRRGSRQWPTTR